MANAWLITYDNSNKKRSWSIENDLNFYHKWLCYKHLKGKFIEKHGLFTLHQFPLLFFFLVNLAMNTTSSTCIFFIFFFFCLSCSLYSLDYSPRNAKQSFCKSGFCQYFTTHTYISKTTDRRLMHNWKESCN